MSINELPLSNNTSSLTTGISSQQLSQLWRGKTLQQLTPKQTGNIEKYVPTHPPGEVPSKMGEHTFIKLETSDNQSFIANIADVASILSMNKTDLQQHIKDTPQVLTTRFQKAVDLKPLPQRSKDDIRKELIRNSKNDFQFHEWQEHIDLITHAYETLANDPGLLLNLKGDKTTTSEYFSKQKSNALLKSSIIQGSDGELYLVLPKGKQLTRKPGQPEGQWSAALGAGEDSIYTRLVNLHTLTPMALGRVRHTLRQSGKKVNSPQEQRQQIQKEIELQKKLLENFTGKIEDFPFVRLKAMVSHESTKPSSADSTKGQEKYARLTEKADHDLISFLSEMDSVGMMILADPQFQQHSIQLIRDLLNALVLMKKSGIIHCDLKPDNIMIVRLPNNQIRLKVADFGYADFVEEAKKGFKGSIKGTPDYFSYNQYHSRDINDVINPSNDLWAAGIVMYGILTGNLPPFAVDANSYNRDETVQNHMDYTREDIQRGVIAAPIDTVLGLVNRIFTEDPPPTVEDFQREFEANLAKNGTLVPPSVYNA